MDQEKLPQLPQPEDQAVLPGGEASGALPEGGTQLPIDPEVAKGVGQRVVASETDGSVPASRQPIGYPNALPSDAGRVDLGLGYPAHATASANGQHPGLPTVTGPQIMANKPPVSPATREAIGDNPYLPDGTQPKV